MEEVKTAVSINNFSKKFKGFTLDVPCLKIPQGFATALIGENGAGKTTLLNALAGVRLDYKGNMEFFGQWDDKEREKCRLPCQGDDRLRRTKQLLSSAVDGQTGRGDHRPALSEF